MKICLKPTLMAMSLGCAGLLASFPTGAEDIDIFVGSSAGSAGNANVLIVLDNTPNWARSDEKWPDGVKQGQAEVDAIKQVIQSLDSTINVGLMEFVTGGNANDNGGYIRFPVVPMTAANKTALSSKLTTIYNNNNINDPNEKTNGSRPYGNLMYDVYNYFAGGNSYSPNGVIGSLVSTPPDSNTNGYATNYTKFQSPLSQGNLCARNFVIFIGNPRANGPVSDDSANTQALASLNGNTTQLPLPEFKNVGQPVQTTLGNSSQCYGSLSAAQAAYGWGLNVNDNLCQLYSAVGTLIGSAIDVNGVSCSKYSGTGTNTVTATDYQTQCSTYTDGCTLGTAVPNPPMSDIQQGYTAYLASAPAATAADAGAKAGLTCPANAITPCTYTVTISTNPADTLPSIAASSADSTSCYYVGNGSNPNHLAQWTDPLSNGVSHDYGTLTCPANYTCSYVKTGNDQNAVCQGISGNVKKAVIQMTPTPMKKYLVTQTTQVPGGSCPANTNAYPLIGTNLVLTNQPTGNTFVDTGPRNADEWSRFLYQNGIPVTGADTRPSVSTFTIDVYNAKPNAVQTSLLLSMAEAGGGSYYSANNEQQIMDALQKILVKIQAVNSTFASTSLPVNATNRTQNENQVFIGMFRPDQSAKPRWFGNLKRYQLIDTTGSGNIDLGDKNGKSAVNTVTGFLDDCATSFWTTDSGTYWNGVTDGVSPSPSLLDPTTVKGKCAGFEPYSDLPDGPLVEKGAVAEVIRTGNAPGNLPTWAVNRNIYTESGVFDTSSGLSQSLVDFISGKDVNNEKANGQTSATRPSLHGDVIHSRPVPINYGDKGIVVYYGANDGMFHAVDAAGGQEKWAFIASEFFPRLSRLMTDSPLVSFRPTPIPGSTPKDYFFDGSTGFYQSADNSKIWLFPTMRRGGRMIYALDVANPATPVFKWKVGCTSLTSDSGCTADSAGDFNLMGQTWSTPRAARIKGYGSSPVLIVGGGYDGCEDTNAVSPCDSSAKGGIVYILDANTGQKIRAFRLPTDKTGGRVAADIALLDIDGDGYADYAYAVDTGGNIHRIDFISSPSGGVALTPSQWTLRRVAYTNGAGRKFLFAPAVFANSGKAYLALGSGDREHPLLTDYPYTSVVNRFYVYKDDLATTSGSVDLDSLADYTANTDCSTPPVLPNSTLKGWFMTLNQYGKGEQTVTSALIATGMVTFSTNRPLDSSTASCTTPLGEARGYWVNLLNASGAIGVDGLCGGTRSSTFVGGGLPPSPVMASSVPITGGQPTSVVIGAVKRKGSGTNCTICAQPNKPPINTKRSRVYSYTKGEN